MLYLVIHQDGMILIVDAAQEGEDVRSIPLDLDAVTEKKLSGLRSMVS